MNYDVDLNKYTFTGSELAEAQKFARDFAGDDDIGTGLTLGLMKFFGAIGEPGEKIADNDYALQKSQACEARLIALARLTNDPRMNPYQLDSGKGYKRANPLIFDAAARCALCNSQKAGEWCSFTSADDYFAILLEMSETHGQS
jgi:hypothetical protein